MTYRELLFWLGAEAEAVWLEYLAKCAVPVVDLTGLDE
jgi:hypothetical protein